NTHTWPRSVRARKLTDDAIGLGVGSHGEPGRYRVIAGGAGEIADKLVQPILSDLPFDPGDGVLVLVSGLGGTPPLELYLFFEEVYNRLVAAKLRVERQLVGNYLTSLGRGGCIVTVLRLDDELTRLWDAPV